MGSTSETKTYDRLVTSTFENLQDGGSVQDAIHESTPFLAFLKEKGRISLSYVVIKIPQRQKRKTGIGWIRNYEESYCYGIHNLRHGSGVECRLVSPAYRYAVLTQYSRNIAW